MRIMTKKEARKEFAEYIKPYVVAKYGADDYIAIREAWNDWTDFLCKEGRITDWQYNNWSNPY